MLQTGNGARAERCSIHDDGVTLHAAVKIQMRAVAGVKNRIVFENDDGRLDGNPQLMRVGSR